MESAVKQRLQQLLDREEVDIDLAEAALLLCTEEYPALDIPAYLWRLDVMAAGVRAQLSASASPWDVIVLLNKSLFAEEGFAANSDDYYDPRNSLLNEVLDRKLGIPITLSILYMAVAHRLGLQLQGISFPGHFLVKLVIEGGQIVLDPYHGGAALTEDDLLDRLNVVYEERSAPIALDQALVSATKKEVLLRVLRNLKNIYLGQQDIGKALRALDGMLLIMPESAEEWRDRGLLYRRLECFRPALGDLKNYLRLAPDAADADEMRACVIQLQTLAERLN